MKIILCSFFMVVAAAAGPLVNTTMHIGQPIGETFETIALTTSTSRNLENPKPLKQNPLPIFKPVALETTVEGLIIPDPLPGEEVELPEDTLTTIFNSILPFKIAVIVAKIVTLAVTTVALIFLGKAVSGAIGQFFSGFKADDVVSKTNETVDRVRRAVEILQLGINKYDGIQGLGELYGNFLE
ncbi:hypothetical protein ACFFRR_005897 [Megaselia abdita]